jgi:hypothetical protein
MVGDMVRSLVRPSKAAFVPLCWEREHRARIKDYEKLGAFYRKRRLAEKLFLPFYFAKATEYCIAKDTT